MFRPIYGFSVLVRKAFRYRIYPSEEQKLRLSRWEGALRWLWNLALEQRRMGLARPHGEQRFPTAFDQINELTALRAEVPWLADAPRNVCAQLLVELDKAFQRCFKRLGKAPHFKRKGRDAVTFCEPHSKVFSLDGETLHFPKLGPVKTVVHRPLQGKPKTASIVREVDQWFVSLVCEVEMAEPAPRHGPAVAIDRGVVALLADSDGKLTPNPAFGEASAEKIATVQQRAAKKTKGSNNQRKERKKVGRQQRKARRQREHLLHTLSHRYAKSHGVVVLEELRIANMTASAKGTVEEPGRNVAQKAGLNRRILDSGWGLFERLLSYKLEATGGRVEKVAAAYSSQTCAACSHVDAKSRVSQNEFVCTACGAQAHADVNAAKVLLSRRTGGERLPSARREAPAKQKLRVVRRGTVKHGGGSQSPAAHGGDGLRGVVR